MYFVNTDKYFLSTHQILRFHTLPIDLVPLTAAFWRKLPHLVSKKTNKFLRTCKLLVSNLIDEEVIERPTPYGIFLVALFNVLGNKEDHLFNVLYTICNLRFLNTVSNPITYLPTARVTLRGCINIHWQMFALIK